MQKLPEYKKGRTVGLERSRAGRPLFIIPAICLLAAVTLHAQTSLDAPENERLAPPQAAVVNLYFADNKRFALVAETRKLAPTDNPVARGKSIIRELAGGPREKRHIRTLPEGDILRAFFIDADKTAYVDFSPEMWRRHPGGIQSDILACYSVVNSLVLNMAEIDAVKFLMPGRDPIATAAHLDLHYPLKANILLIR